MEHGLNPKMAGRSWEVARIMEEEEDHGNEPKSKMAAKIMGGSRDNLGRR